MNNRVSILPFDQDWVNVVGIFKSAYNVELRRFNGDLLTDGNNGTQGQITRYFPKGGHYRVRFIYTKGSNFGKADVGIDTSTNNLFSQIDTYNGTGVNDVVIETFKEIPRGYHNITITANGKNASSTNYFLEIEALFFDLVQEYPEGTYQDDKPAQINQGSMVLLGKHTAVVAESTFTFNFAGITDDLYSEIIVVARGQVTAALNLQLTINGGSTGYYQDGVSAIGGSNANINIDNAAQLTFQSSSILNGANQEIEANAIIKGSKVGTSRPTGRIEAGTFSIGMEESAFGCGSVTTPVTSITVKTSTSTWTVGTTIEVYGIRKV